MSTCPACGVAVVPGYVKCPKCGTGLPSLARTKSNTFGSGGGTAVTDRGSSRNLIVAIGAGLVVAVVLIVVLGGGSKTASTAPSTAEPTADPADDEPGPEEPAAIPTPATAAAPETADPQAAAASLDRELDRLRLWSTVDVSGQRVDVRTGSCDDTGLPPVIDGARPQLRAAGLTKLRCLTQSGGVVFERDL